MNRISFTLLFGSALFAADHSQSAPATPARALESSNGQASTAAAISRARACCAMRTGAMRFGNRWNAIALARWTSPTKWLWRFSLVSNAPAVSAPYCSGHVLRTGSSSSTTEQRAWNDGHASVDAFVGGCGDASLQSAGRWTKRRAGTTIEPAREMRAGRVRPPSPRGELACSGRFRGHARKFLRSALPRRLFRLIARR